MKYETRHDCYNGEYKLDGDHDDKNFITIAHYGYIYLPSNPSNRVEVIIRDHDDISLPCFYILTEDRSKELYKVSLFDNSYTKGLSKEDKIYLNEFIRGDSSIIFSELRRSNVIIFDSMKTMWIDLNLPDAEEASYDNIIDPPYYE